MHSALFDLMRRDHARAAPKAFELAQLAREHELTMYGGAFGAFLEGWASAAAARPAAARRRARASTSCASKKGAVFDGLFEDRAGRG